MMPKGKLVPRASGGQLRYSGFGEAGQGLLSFVSVNSRPAIPKTIKTHRTAIRPCGAYMRLFSD